MTPNFMYANTIQEQSLGDIFGLSDLSNKTLNGHSVIAGQTRSGKTTLAKVLYSALTGHKIFYNIQNDREIYGLSDTTVFTPTDLLSKIMAGYKRINYMPRSESEKSRADLFSIYQILMLLGAEVAKLPQATAQKEYFWSTLFVDEAHIVSPKHSKEDGLSLLTTRGSGVGIRVVSITQRPALLSQTVLTQSPYYFVFYISPLERKYFKNFGLNLNDFRNFFEYTKHRFIMWDGFKPIPCEAIKL